VPAVCAGRSRCFRRSRNIDRDIRPPLRTVRREVRPRPMRLFRSVPIFLERIRCSSLSLQYSLKTYTRNHTACCCVRTLLGVRVLSRIRMFVKLTDSEDADEERPPPVYHYSEMEFEIARQSSTCCITRQDDYPLLTARRRAGTSCSTPERAQEISR
jgi:hypothetical protein